jgi:hypothetical protein
VRENRTHGSEGGEDESPSLPLSSLKRCVYQGKSLIKCSMNKT